MTAPFVRFFLPGIVATELDVPKLATQCRGDRSAALRLSYRFTYRVYRSGPVYGCHIKASRGIVPSLVDQLYILVGKAEADGNTEMLIGCAMALEAMERPTH